MVADQRLGRIRWCNLGILGPRNDAAVDTQGIATRSSWQTGSVKSQAISTTPTVCWLGRRPSSQDQDRELERKLQSSLPRREPRSSLPTWMLVLRCPRSIETEED